MNYLLDTHTFIWAITEKEKLSRMVKDTFANNANLFFVSSITFWEISLKFASGKLTLTGFSPGDMPSMAANAGFKLISLTPEQSSSFYQLTKTLHKDPFDRMLIWQAVQQNLIFITKDDQLHPYKEVGLKTLW